MTYRERLAKEHPECVDVRHLGGCKYCPSDYGYETKSYCTLNCYACWGREMPMTPEAQEEQEEHDLAINAEIIRGYCGERPHCNVCPADGTCRDMPGSWSAGVAFTSAAKQRAMLDAFEAALPTLDEDTEEQEAHDLAANSEIIQAYCDRETECGACPAYLVCGKNDETSWYTGLTIPGCPISAEKQRAMLDAFEAALPPLDEEDGGRPQAAPTEDNAALEREDVRILPVDDPVNHPSHYTAGGIECIDAIAAALTCQKDPMEAWLTGQVLKYLWRWPLKNGVEDLKKARWYLERLIGKVGAA